MLEVPTKANFSANADAASCAYLNKIRHWNKSFFSLIYTWVFLVGLFGQFLRLNLQTQFWKNARKKPLIF